MPSALETLKQRNRGSHTFNDGTTVGFHYLDMETYILDIGHVPIPALNNIVIDGEEPTEEQAREAIAQSPDEFRQQLVIIRRVVTEMIDTIDDVAVEDAERDAVVTELGVEKRQTLFRIANGQMAPSNGKDPNSGEA